MQGEALEQPRAIEHTREEELTSSANGQECNNRRYPEEQHRNENTQVFIVSLQAWSVAWPARPIRRAGTTFPLQRTEAIRI